MATPTDITLQSLIARIAGGEPIAAESIPQALRDKPEIKRLLQLARVAGALESNANAAPVFDPAPGSIGPWRLVRLLGTGGMGEVWLGERSDGTVEHRVAVKRVRVDVAHFRQRLRAERRILARLEHPNIARFVDAGVDLRGSPWLALEFVDGSTITHWCQSNKLPLRDRLRLFQKVCAAVEHAHRHLIVHRDLKPSNVLVNAEGEPKLLDFGIAKLLDGSSAEMTNAALTPAYASPEQLLGQEVSTATDVYALGLLLFRLLAGCLPETRSGDNISSVLLRLDQEETQRPSQRALSAAAALPYAPVVLEGDLDAIVAQSIRARPEQRYGSVVELSADLGRFLDARPVLARAPTRLYRIGRFAQRNRLALSLGALSALALIVGFSVSLHQAARAEREADTARRELARAERVSGFLGSLYREHDPLTRGTATSRSPLAMMSDGVARVKRELADDPLSQAQLLRVLGEAQLNLGDLDRARSTLDQAAQRASDSQDKLLGADIDAIRGTLALRELRQDDAERLFNGALRATVQLRGADSLEAARINARRALSLVWLGRFKDAQATAAMAYQSLTAHLGAEAAETLAAQLMVGTIADQLRNDDEAITVLRANVAAVERGFGPADARLVAALQNLGEVLRRKREFTAARAALTRGADIARAQFGARHSQLASILIRLATIERDSGDPRRAIQVLDQAEAALPEGEINAHAQLLATRGGTRLQLNEAARAEPDFREALRLRRDAGGLRTGLAWFSQAQLAEALGMQGRFSEAHGLYSEAATELRALLGVDAYQNALIAQRWAVTYDLQGNRPAAVAQSREALRLIEKTYGREHFSHFEQSLALAGLLAHSSAGRAEATRIADELITRWNTHPDVANQYVALIELRCALHTAQTQAGAAAALARATVARDDLAITDEQRARLQRYMDGA